MKQTVTWDPEKLRRFWEFEYEVRRNLRFSRVHAKPLVRRIRRASGKRRQRVLDLGCGAGDLVFALAKHYSEVFGADIESSMLKELRLEASSSAGIRFLSNSQLVDLGADFDIITSIETIEHLSNEELDNYIDQVKKLLKPKGLVVITVPNEENLEENMVKCPECSAIFHRVQHVRSWSAGELTSYLRVKGIEMLTTETTYFACESLFGFLGRLVIPVLKLMKKPMPNLFGVGRLVSG